MNASIAKNGSQRRLQAPFEKLFELLSVKLYSPSTVGLRPFSTLAQVPTTHFHGTKERKERKERKRKRKRIPQKKRRERIHKREREI